MDNIEVDFGKSGDPSIPPWKPLDIPQRTAEVRTRVPRTPIPGRGFPVQRVFPQPFDFDFESKSQPSGIASTNPWEVTSNGDDTVNIGYGSLLSYDETSLTLREYIYFAGTVAESYSPVTVTGAGSIYGNISSAHAVTPDINYSGTDSNGDTYSMELLRVFPDTGASIGFSFETTPPVGGSSTFYFEIAKVDLVDGIATITRQVLTHNPTLQSWLEPP